MDQVLLTTEITEFTEILRVFSQWSLCALWWNILASPQD